MNKIRININRPAVLDETEFIKGLYEQKFVQFSKSEMFKIIKFAKMHNSFFIIKDKSYFVLENFVGLQDLSIIKQAMKAGKKTLLYDSDGFVWLSQRYINALFCNKYKQPQTDHRIGLKEEFDLSEALRLQKDFYAAAQTPRIKKTKSYLLR